MYSFTESFSKLTKKQIKTTLSYIESLAKRHRYYLTMLVFVRFCQNLIIDKDHHPCLTKITSYNCRKVYLLFINSSKPNTHEKYASEYRLLCKGALPAFKSQAGNGWFGHRRN